MRGDERRQVIDLLDVKVRITEWHSCGNCSGSGRIPGGKGKLGGFTCPVCHGTRHVPTFRITGVVQDDALRTVAKVGEQREAEAKNYVNDLTDVGVPFALITSVA